MILLGSWGSLEVRAASGIDPCKAQELIALWGLSDALREGLTWADLAQGRQFHPAWDGEHAGRRGETSQACDER
jgi:hypothetical protein